MKKYLWFLILVPGLSFGRQSCMPDEKLGTALVISNRVPIEADVRKIVSGLKAEGIKIFDARQDVDLKGVNQTNSPFAKDIGYAMKISVLNESYAERVYRFSVTVLRLSDGGMASTELAVPKENFAMLVAELYRLLCRIFPGKITSDPVVTDVSTEKFSFPMGDFYGLRKGDEITVRYAQAREGLTESYAIVRKVSVLTNGSNISTTVEAKDLAKAVKTGDTILRKSPQRNRFSFTLSATVVAGGTMPLQARDGARLWKGSGVWPAGLIFNGEYERLLPYQLVSTTVFGINVDGMLGTFVFTGIGYRVIYRSWEFVPYLRLGVMYNPLVLDGVTADTPSMQGAGFRFGLNFGMSFMKRLGSNLFLGLDLGAQWYPLSYGAMLVSSQSIKPQWKNGSGWSDKLSLPSIYPYLGLKFGWTF